MPTFIPSVTKYSKIEILMLHYLTSGFVDLIVPPLYHVYIGKLNVERISDAFELGKYVFIAMTLHISNELEYHLIYCYRLMDAYS